jgi:3alpha(or 20beta)-hydroxysteroid dehydrogenase
MGRVDGKVALITGGTRGMGAAHAQALVSEGARVVIGDILDGGRAVAEKLGESAHFVHLDVTDPGQWDQAIDAAVNRFGRLDALVNNAGIVKLGSLRGSSVSDWQRVLDVSRGIGRQRPPTQLRGRQVRPPWHHQIGRS